MKRITTVTLMATTMLLTVALSVTPRTSSRVTRPMTTMAGRFIMPTPTSTPSWFLTITPGAAWNAAGMSQPTSCIRLTK